MMRVFALGLGFVGLPLTASAQSTFDRFETVAVAMNALMNEALIAEIPALEGNLPDPEWDDSMRTAYTCMYNGYVARVGEAPVAEMVTGMEDMLASLSPVEMLQGGGAVENPDGISDADALEIVGGCNLMDVFEARMTESGAMEIMMQQQ